MTNGPTAGLAALLEGAVAELAEVERHVGPGGVEWSTRETVFAAVDGARAAFRLAPPVVAAALRTPATERSTRGPDWVAFAPGELDAYAIDRAEAWLASAWRRAVAQD